MIWFIYILTFWSRCWLEILADEDPSLDDKLDHRKFNELNDEYQPRVHEGADDDKSEYSYVVSIEKAFFPYSRTCSGSLLSATWVLTAAHCMKSSPTRVRYADFTKHATNTTSFVNILDTFKHPNYFIRGTRVKNDLGLMSIQSVPKTMFGKLSAVDYLALIGVPVTYAGFGGTRNTEIENLYKEEQLKPVKYGEGLIAPCSTQLKWLWIPSLCVIPKCSKKKQGIRGSDSGGPLVYSGKIVGVCVWREGYDITTGAYAPISPNIGWIHEIITKNTKENTLNM